MRWLMIVLLLILASLQFRLWFGEGSISQKTQLDRELSAQQVYNEELKHRNKLIAKEVESLKNNLDIDTKKYFKVIKDKTAKLFSSSAMVGGIISKRPEKIISKLDKFGHNIGIAFQLLDDALDYECSENNTGKNIGDDFKEGKITLPVLLALKKANSPEKTFWKRVIEDLDQEKDDFKKAQCLLAKYNCINETKIIAREYAEKAEEILKIFPQNIYNDALVNLTKFVFTRSN